MSTQAVILAGGKGTRLAPYTATIPKPLVPINQYPILEIILRQLKYYGIRDVTLALGHMAGLIESYFGNGRQFGLNIRTSTEKKPLGTAGPLAQLRNLRGTVLVLNGDLFTTLNFKQLIKFHEQRQADATIGLYRQELKVQSGVITTDLASRVIKYDEKPTSIINVSMGVYVFTPPAIRLIPKNTFFNLPDLIDVLLSSGRIVYGYKNTADWLDIGRPDDYSKAVSLFKENPKRYLKR